MRQSKCILFFLVLGLLLPGCGLFKKEEKPAPTGPKTTLIGVVEMVNPEQSYVLIRCEQPPLLPTGTELVAVDPAGGESSIRLTPERKGRYLTADIKSGQPKVGSFVMHRTTGDAPVNTPFAPDPIPTVPAIAPIPLDPLASPPSPLQPTLPSLAPLPFSSPSESPPPAQ
ncbi:hypothetical protein WJU23_05710 [Prosthecobacter sp. SYSU 5D2]|uniref:hypothetical protein n=1 Tax=Prosthecobacter sp. SYSU 5D2 TaxID=3134134 RepID=UPI0031FF0FE5